MLFKEVHLQAIKLGKITLAFRKWEKASVRPGSLLHTAIGVVKIHKIEAINENDITTKDLLKAGFTDKNQLLKSFTNKSTGTIFKISISYHSEDPRIQLREQSELSDQQYTDLKKKLEKLDNHSQQGHWTEKILLTIRDHPNLHAVGIAKLTGFEKEWLKLNIRKLKNLGLTISHIVGYELSSLGNAYVKNFYKKNDH